MLRYLNAPQDLIPLELTIPSRGPQKPREWQLHEGKTLSKVFPSAPASIKYLQSPNQSSLIPPWKERDEKKKDQIVLDEVRLKQVKIRRTLPHFNSQLQKGVSRLALRQMPVTPQNLSMITFVGIAKPSTQCLNRIFKEAKNLTSVILEPECGPSTLKTLRKMRDLRNLVLKIQITEKMEFPRLFKNLNRLQMVSLTISPAKQWGSHMSPAMSKVFRFLLDLPRLEHLHVRLEDCRDYFKTLLQQMHQKKLASFHIVVYNAHDFSGPSLIPWRNYIDTLYLGRINVLPYETHEKQFDDSLNSESPQKRLSLNPGCFKKHIIELAEGSEILKSLYVVDFFHFQESPSLELTKPLLNMISKTRTLENLTLIVEATFKNYGEIMHQFIKQIFDIETLENLQSLTFNIKSSFDQYPHLPLPYSSRMRNLKSLKIKIDYCPLTTDISYLVEGLKDMVSLEHLEFDYNIGNLQMGNWNRINCNLPAEGLKNLKSLVLRCNGIFSEISINQLVNCIGGISGLESLFISSRILDCSNKNQAARLTESLCSKESLETAEFAWKEEGTIVGSRVFMKRINGEIVILSESYL